MTVGAYVRRQRRRATPTGVTALGVSLEPPMEEEPTTTQAGQPLHARFDRLSPSVRDGTAGREILSLNGPVLVGTDDSESSRDALALGRMLADAIGSQLLSVYVHHFEDVGPLLSGGPPTEALELIDEVAASKDRRARALAAATDARPLPMSTARTVAAGLHQLAANQGAALIALGSSHSHSKFTVTASTAQRLISRQTHAVAIAPVNHRQKRDLKVVRCALDESPAAQRVLQWAINFTERSQTDLDVIATPPDGPHASGWLTKLQRSDDLDLLIIGSKASGPVRAALRRDAAAELIRTSCCPTVLIPVSDGGY